MSEAGGGGAPSASEQRGGGDGGRAPPDLPPLTIPKLEPSPPSGDARPPSASAADGGGGSAPASSSDGPAASTPGGGPRKKAAGAAGADPPPKPSKVHPPPSSKIQRHVIPPPPDNEGAPPDPDKASDAVPPPAAGAEAAAPPPAEGGAKQPRRKKARVKESVIDHTYRDFSQVKVGPDDDPDVYDDRSEKQQQQNHHRPNFPAKLHAIVSNPAYQHIICWLPHGRSWKIVDKYQLTQVIIPQHFAHAKFESFNRSVNGWGFKRLLNPGPDCKSYYHECFLRGRPELTRLMQRLVNPGKRLPDKSGEPDFYEISKSFPLPSLPSSSVHPAMPPAGGRPPPQDRMHPGPALPSPGNARQPPVLFSSPPPHMNGYYGYPPAAPYPPMPSPGGGQGPPPPGGRRPPPPPQQQQMPYWPTQMSGSPPMPTPSPYGYYPYPSPHVMMMGPQGYYGMGAGQPYPPAGPGGPPGAPYNPYLPPAPVGPAAARSEPLPTARAPGKHGGPDAKNADLAAVAEISSVAGDDSGDPDEADAKPGAAKRNPGLTMV